MFAALMIAALVATQSTEQFDLVCAGTSSHVSDGMPPVLTASNTRIRVDLRRGVWCINDCQNHSEFVSISPTEFLLEDGSHPYINRITRTVNRTNGHYSVILQSPNSWLRVAEKCERAPHTPIPTAKF